jgi:hypothetical protein
VPVADTLSVVDAPAVIVREVGCAVIAGAVQGGGAVPGYTDCAALMSHDCRVKP